MGSLFEDPQALGQAIRSARRQAEMSHQELADAVGRSKSTVIRWENGEEGAKGRTPQARRSLAAMVAEATGADRTELGLSALAEPADPTRDRVKNLETRLLAVISEARTDQEDLRRRLERLERGLGGTGG